MSGESRVILVARLLLGMSLAGSPLGAQDTITENHPNGQPFRVYAVDAENRKEGGFEQFRLDGKLEIRAEYHADQLHGKFESFFRIGGKNVSARYNKGRKHGLWREFAKDGRSVVFKTYRYDVLHGSYQSFHDNGKKKLTTTYRDGQLDGRYQQFGADGEWHRNANYKAGKLHGKVTIKRGRKVQSKQRWIGGEIRDLDGIRPFPRSETELRGRINVILHPPADPKEPAPKKRRPKRGRKSKRAVEAAVDPKAAVRAAALRRLKAYRYLCGLRYEDMTLVPKWNDLCDAASEVCRANGGLSHHPPRPSGFDADRYAKGVEGASHSNLAGGGGMVRSVDAYMDDSDASNIDRIGHRRWCLNPGMKFTGFGGDGGYAAMWSMDGSGSTPKGMAAVFFPPPGKVPIDFFGPRYAWSITVLRGRSPRKGTLKVTVHELDEYFQPLEQGLELDHLDIAGGGFGGGSCLVFRPVGLRVQPGARYLARISLDGGKTEAYRYVVEFCAAVAK